MNEQLGITSVVVSHDVTETLSIADYVYILAGGKVAGHGTPAMLKQSEVPEIKQFIKGLPDGPVSFQYPATDYEKDLMGG